MRSLIGKFPLKVVEWKYVWYYSLCVKCVCNFIWNLQNYCEWIAMKFKLIDRLVLFDLIGAFTFILNFKQRIQKMLPFETFIVAEENCFVKKKNGKQHFRYFTEVFCYFVKVKCRKSCWRKFSIFRIFFFCTYVWIKLAFYKTLMITVLSFIIN